MGKASGVLALVGAALIVAGVFSKWLDGRWTGWELYEKTEGILDFYYAPLVILALGAVTALVACVAIGGKGGAGSRIVFSLAGMGTVALFVMFFNEFIVLLSGGTIGFIEVILDHRDILGIGFYMVLGGGILTSISASIPGK